MSGEKFVLFSAHLRKVVFGITPYSSRDYICRYYRRIFVVGGSDRKVEMFEKEIAMNYRIFITGSGIAEEAQRLLRENNCTFETGDPKDTPAAYCHSDC